MSNTHFTMGSEVAAKNMLIPGTSGSGKSLILEKEAKRRGIPNEDLVKELEPTAEEIEVAQISEDNDRKAAEKRLQAVREAFWSNTPEDDAVVDHLHDALVANELVAEPSPEQVKILFMMLPGKIIGSGLSWGFSDTEVRESIYAFVDENKQKVIDAIQC